MPTKQCPMSRGFIDHDRIDGKTLGCKSRVIGTTGITGSVLIILGLVVPVIAYPGYDFSRQFISDLGMASSSPLSSFFNWCLIVNGMLTTITIVQTGFIASRKWISILVIISGIVAGTGVTLVGCYPMDVHPEIHLQVATVAFFGMMLVSISVTAAIFTQEVTIVPRSHAITGIASCITMLMLGCAAMTNGFIIDIASRPEFYTVSILEWVSIVTFVTWMAIMSIHQVT